MVSRFKRILIIADIEGSSGCWNYKGSSFKTDEWARACLEMTYDVNAVIRALIESDVKHITVKDFHRTGFNLLPELIDPRSEIIQGFRAGPVPGVGDPGKAEAVLFMGMHAASGTDGFLAHTLTTRIEKLEVNGIPLAEIELFASSLAPHGVRPIFFSACPVGCEQAKNAVPNITTYPIDKALGVEGFDIESWRSGLAKAAISALSNGRTTPYMPEGPFCTLVRMRDGETAARKVAHRWKFDHKGSQIFFEASNMQELYMNLIRMCYLTPLIEKNLPFCLFAYNLWGRIGLAWVRRRLKQLQLA